MSIAERFGHNLKRARKDTGLSQEEAGILASLHRTEVGLLERGECIPRIATAIKLAGAIGVPFDAWLDGIAWTPGATTPGVFILTSLGAGRIAEGAGKPAQVVERPAPGDGAG